MRTYYEAREITEDGMEAEFIRIDVTDSLPEPVVYDPDSPETATPEPVLVDVMAALKDLMADKTAIFTVHKCGHDEYRGCTMEDV